MCQTTPSRRTRGKKLMFRSNRTKCLETFAIGITIRMLLPTVAGYFKIIKYYNILIKYYESAVTILMLWNGRMFQFSLIYLSHKCSVLSILRGTLSFLKYIFSRWIYNTAVCVCVCKSVRHPAIMWLIIWIYTVIYIEVSYRAKSSLSNLTSSSAVHWSESEVNPQMSANRILKYVKVNFKCFV